MNYLQKDILPLFLLSLTANTPSNSFQLNRCFFFLTHSVQVAPDMEPPRPGPSSVCTGQRRHVRAISNSAINALRVQFSLFCIFISDYDLLFKIHLFLFYASRLSAKYYLFYLSVPRFTFMSSLFLDLFVHFFLLPTSLTLLHLSPPCLTLPYLTFLSLPSAYTVSRNLSPCSSLRDTGQTEPSDVEAAPYWRYVTL